MTRRADRLEPMIFVKSILGGVVALIVAALIIYALAAGVPRVLELIPGGEGGIGVYSVAPFPLWLLVIVTLLVFSGGFYRGFRRARRFRRSHKG